MTSRIDHVSIDCHDAFALSTLADLRKPGGTGWMVLADPEGNESCILRSDAERSEQA